ncbi:hypothetical protein F4678DRAFT_442576 [Xylaria arbuscula]|nr:hypothetical protein F4678DRAFT_442576 [Xylaria arbuscula]
MFHVLTAAHNLWDPKLGPAKMAVLYLDDRVAQDGKPFNMCLTVAINADWIKRYSVENDFCMVAVEQPFNSGVRLLRCLPEPGPSCAENGMVLGFSYDLPFNAPSKHLIRCEGPVTYRESEAILIIEHRINTVGGNSGSPLIVDDQFVGVHSTFIRDQKINMAAPVNRNGNSVEHFSGVLRYMRGQISKLPGEIEDLGRATCVTAKVRMFGEGMTPSC